ncbi:MAG: ABC transporter ATP-binding protein [Nitrospiraceae bacterium]|nr:ABC transporter ATP-binding protein [Nitrospiraceae bacterium]
MLELDGVSLSFGGVRAVNNLSFEIPDGQITALIGPNGAGKTSILNVISRFYTPQHGRVTFDGKDLLQLPPSEIIDVGIARSFQNVALFKELSVVDNLKIGTDHRSSAGLFSNMFRLPRAVKHERDARREAEEVLEFLDIEAIAERRSGTLSYGHQKLVDLGRALVSRPKLLLLDEPAAGTSEGLKAWLATKIKEIPERFGCAVLLIDHDMLLVLGVSQKVVVVDFGSKIAQGTPDEIRQDRRVIAAYLGEES